MLKNRVRLVCLCALACLSLPAQNTAGTGSISGTVSDASGSAVPGAQVIVANESKGIRRELTTSESGNFNAPSLTPAAGYSVSITKAGFATFETKNIDLQVGQTVNLTPAISVAAAAARVEVTSEAPVVESTKSEVSGLVDSHQILELPINGRRVDNFVLLQPGVTSDAAFGLLTFRGLAGGNSFLTDGIDTTNSFYDENAGRTRTYNISQDAVQEFQVVTSGSLAEYGKASGGIVNTITRSGTNSYHGTGYWFFRNRTLNATDISANGLKPQDWRHQAGISIGGPIKKDKLFFFFNGEVQRRFFPIASSNIQNSLFNNTNSINTSSSVCGAPATAAQCAAAQAFVTSRAATQLVPREADVNLLFGKIDYQLNDRNRASFEMNYVDFHSPNGIQTQVALINGAALGNNANTTVFDRTGKAGLTTIISPEMVNEFKFGYFKDRQYDPASASLLPTIGPVGLSISGNFGISNIGYATSYPRLNPSEQRFEVADTLSYSQGKHNMKYGFDFDTTEDYVNQLSTQFGSYTYANFTAFAQDFSGNAAGGKHWSAYSQRFGTPVVDTSVPSFAAFLQDEWHVTPKLTISPGIRYEKSFIPQPVDIYPNLINPKLPQTNHIPQIDLNFAPRFGVAYAMNDKTVLRGDFGIFHNRYVTSAVSNFLSSNGAFTALYSLSATGSAGPAQVAAGPVFPFPLAAAPNVPGAATPTIPDAAFRPSYSEQASASIERQLSRTSSLTVSYIWDRALHLVSAYDANVAAPTQSYTYPILNAQNQVVSSFTTPLYTKRLNPAFGAIVAATSSNNSYYSGLAVQYNKRYSSWFQAQVSYTYSHAIDYDIGGGGNTLFTPGSPTSVYNGAYSLEKGSSSTDQRHHMVANFVATPKMHGAGFAERYFINGWELSGIVTAASAQPLVPTISVSAAPAGLLSRSTLDGLGGSTRVPFESISALDSDELYRTDARLSKMFVSTERFHLTLMFEAFNVFNHHYYAGTGPRNTLQYSTVNYTLNGQTVVALSPNALYGAWGTTSAPLEGTTARRAQAALRFEF